jgi:hypothetical protein
VSEAPIKSAIEEARLWEMLNYIENWEKSKDDITDPKYQQMLAELKTTLLKIIPKIHLTIQTATPAPAAEVRSILSVLEIVLEVQWFCCHAVS